MRMYDFNKYTIAIASIAFILMTAVSFSGCTDTTTIVITAVSFPPSTAQSGQTQTTTLTTTGSTVTTTQVSTTTTVTHDTNLPTELIQPSDLTYMGAFRLPDGPWSEEVGWGWSGGAMTYFPGGDVDGLDDGYPGSIFGLGHDWNTYVSEFSIPEPVISSPRNVNELNTAATLQDFADITGGMYTGYMEIPRVGLEYLLAQGDQISDKLYFCWAPHLDEGNTEQAHGWCELDLSDPQPAGLWGIDNQWNYVTTDYIFQIPQQWADTYTPGMILATGRFRDGGQGSMGPSLFAYGPWNQGNPPASETQLNADTLLLYSDVYEGEQYTLNDYHHSDEWSGAAWLTAGDKSAVIFVGTKGRGECWYGDADGPCLDCAGERGWWSDTFAGQLIFYSPVDLAAVATGQMEPYEPQPYAVLDIDEYLYHVSPAVAPRRCGEFRPPERLPVRL